MNPWAAPLLHVGYHKTGSTWLQRGLFADEGAGFCFPWDKERDTRPAFVLVNPFEFDPKETAERFAPGLAATAERGLVAVLSNERLAGSPFAGGFDARAIAERLASTFPEGMVLIVIREQRRMVESTYRQYVKVGGAESAKRFLHPPTRGPSRVPLFNLRHFEYHHVIGAYQQLLGPERVLVLPVEMLAADPQGFAASIQRFAGASGQVRGDERPRNRGLTALEVEVKRRMDRFLVRDTVNPTALVDRPDANDRVLSFSRLICRRLPSSWSDRAEARLDAIVRAAVEARFELSNQRTAELTGLELAQFGYRC